MKILEASCMLEMSLAPRIAGTIIFLLLISVLGFAWFDDFLYSKSIEYVEMFFTL